LLPLHRRPDRAAQVGVGGEFFFVPEDRKDPFRDDVAALVGFADEVLGHFVAFQLLMQPGGPLAAGLLVVQVAIGDERPILLLEVLDGELGGNWNSRRLSIHGNPLARN